MADDVSRLPDILKRCHTFLSQEFAKAGFRVAMLWQRESIRNANRSPTMAQMRAARGAKWDAKGRKPTAKQKAAWEASRDPRATSRAKPGGLERSIKAASGVTWGTLAWAEVFVPSDSEAATYAVKIHDEKGRTWRNRGVGTIAKGDRADEKFITRALEAESDKFRDIFDQTLDRAIKHAVFG